ncbi:uncharacterized protein LOC142553644 [Primulina tabacum]|uniref:uncharacterized protein LOC142553644 n=1 Tax=Primulina tabacum TaxID=48773 RepID=UPI003F590F6E
MDFDGHESCFGHALLPALVSLSPFTSSASPFPRRLLSRFKQPNKPVRAKRQLAWLSLQGRLVGADEASSAKAIDKKGVFSVEEAETWDFFNPIQRVLIVAVVAAAAMNSKKNRQIFELRKSVELTDQVLLSMQHKLDCLCKEIDYFKDQPEIVVSNDYSYPTPNDYLVNAPTKEINGDDVFKYKLPLLSEVGPEERRMSDLSDWAPSVASSVDVKLDASANNQTINNLQMECEEKDVIIKELSTILHKSEAFGSKRISKLEDIICRKNMIINKLRKDMLILEQKVVSLTRLRRPSFTAPSSNVEHLPIMADNVLYDIDSTTSASSSDSDSNSLEKTNKVPSLKRPEISVRISEKDTNEDLKNNQVQSSTVIGQQHQRLHKTSSLKQKPLNQTHNSVPSLKPKRVTHASRENRSRGLLPN